MKFTNRTDHVGILKSKLIPYLLALLILLSLQPFAAAQAPVPAGAQQGYDFIQADQLKAMLTFFASDELEGRETGERGLQIAAKYLASQYALAGLKPAPGQRSMLQTFYLIESKLKPATSLSAKYVEKGVSFEKKYAMFTDFLIMSPGTQSLNFEAPVVFAGYGLTDKDAGYDDFKGLKADGKIVMVLSGKPDFLQSQSPEGRMRRFAIFRDMQSKSAAAKKAGAITTLLVSETPIPEFAQGFRRWLERPRMSLMSPDERIPVIIISKNVANAVLKSSKSSVAEMVQKISDRKKPLSVDLKKSSVELNLEVEINTKITQNVVAYLEGSDPKLKNEVVGFSAHYDHLGVNNEGGVYNGADDDGSGTIGILEIARAFASSPQKPKRSLLFISHTGEEKGLLGSEYYVEHPVIPLKQMVADLNIDMIGRNEENSVYIIGSNFLSTELHNLNEEANKTVGLNLDYKYNRRDDPNNFYGRSDHYNYAKNGIPIIFYFTGTHEDYHQTSDTVAKINFDKMEKITRLVYLTGWKAANLDHRIVVDKQADIAAN